MTKHLLKIGCIGAGHVFGHHARGWADCDKAEIVAISDPDTGALDRQGEAFGIGFSQRRGAEPRIKLAEIVAGERADINAGPRCSRNELNRRRGRRFGRK